MWRRNSSKWKWFKSVRQLNFEGSVHKKNKKKHIVHKISFANFDIDKSLWFYLNIFSANKTNAKKAFAKKMFTEKANEKNKRPALLSGDLLLQTLQRNI